ncbi:hypothetical protein L3Q82_005715 [Scortum barcoo]|uniref:Uncharacterized protein n=1 Tax=Scortum barcoo TaxID=214431 RepID=A0ACB8V9F4_9TELE|nr:hypothetical protein L3Q82_005715 [Scortum barcoo]
MCPISPLIKEVSVDHLRGTEKRVAKDPVRAESYIQEVKKLLDAGYVSKLTPAEVQSFTSESEAKHLVNKLQQLLLSGGFELRQWATNAPEIISHMPPESKSESSELWLSMDGAEALERTLGLLWHCMSDTITYQLYHTEHPEPTMRSIYRVLARQCYIHSKTDISTCIQSIHIFSDALEKAYGSVAYLRTVDQSGEIQVAFLAARSRVAPVRQQSILRLELCASHIGAQLAAVLKKELTLHISSVTYWTDSTTDKVFVGTRVVDIQELTEACPWRYVKSEEIPADDITRGLTLSQLLGHNHWSNGPAFLQQNEASWLASLDLSLSEEPAELRKANFCGHQDIIVS